MRLTMKAAALAAVGALGIGAVAATAVVIAGDFGLERDAELASEANDLFGILQPLAASSTTSLTAAQAKADPTKLVTLAPPLKATLVSGPGRGNPAPVIDQMALWPAGPRPEWIIACNEEGTTSPGLQRINIATGEATTILTGTNSCDGVRRTTWGTILFSEESGTTGATYELVDPLNTTNVSLDRGTGVFSGGTGATNLVRRDAVGRLSFEGHGLLPNGVMYYGDENRPGTGTAGGAYFKFVPATPYAGGAPITDLTQSPLASGKVYGLRLGKRNGGTDYGQGTQTGLGTWIDVTASVASLRSASTANKLTGYYRPEDLEVSPTDLAAGNVKVCGNNTGNEFTDHNWGETICITDGTVEASLANTATPEAQYFVVNSQDMAMTDNIAPQPGPSGRWIIVEDGDVEVGNAITPGKNNDMFYCLRDGADADTQSDGCIKIGSLNDAGGVDNPSGAEWTGPIFSDNGKDLYVSVQHNVTGSGTILKISGFKSN